MANGFNDLVLSASLGVFGESISYLPLGSVVSTTINGLFKNEWVEVNEVSTLKPTLLIQVSSLAVAPKRGDRPTINGVVYKTTDVQLDGLGAALLILEKVS